MAATLKRKTWGMKPAEAGPRSAVSATTEASNRDAGEDGVSPGDVIGNRYLLTSLLGEGGMGAIWLARDLKLDIDVALKFIHRELATEQNAERLLQEARAVARLDHPSIVRIFDFGETESGEPFMALEVLRGELFSEVLERKGHLAAPNAVCTLLPVASAVAAAHAKEVVHRDLKPENILLVTNEESGSVVPKVLDFGIAKLRSKGGKARRITENDAIVGTPDYMPPEQASGVGEVDARADVWALCVVLYEAITGHRPFVGQTPAMVLIGIASQAPVPTTEYGVGDEALWKILEQGLEKDASKRFQTMRELGTALARWAVDSGAETDVAGTSLSVHWLAQRARRPLSELPPSPDVPVDLEGALEEQPRPAPAPPPPPAASPAPAAASEPTRTPAHDKPKAPARTGGTWPPPHAVLDNSSVSLQSLIEPVSLPPELAPWRRWKWIGWLALIGAAIAILWGLRGVPEIRSLWDALGVTTPAPIPSGETGAPTSPSPGATTEPTRSVEPPASALPRQPSARPPPRRR